jgi:hypothetical protein
MFLQQQQPKKKKSSKAFAKVSFLSENQRTQLIAPLSFLFPVDEQRKTTAKIQLKIFL